MKQSLLHTSLAATALAALALTAACTSTDDNAPELTIDPVISAVKTQFAISIPKSAQTRMSEANTQQQQTPAFLGMNDLFIVPFAGESATASGTAIKLSPNIGSSDLTDQHKIYTNVEIPVGTTNFLFYGTAPMGTDATSYFQKGIVTPAGLTAGSAAPASGITFSAKNVMTTAQATEFSTKMSDICTYLKSIADVTDFNNIALLAPIYAKLVQPTTQSTARSVAGTDLKDWMQELWTALDGITATDPADLQATITAVKNAITASYFDAPAAGATDLTYKADAPINAQFPATTYNLPDGAAVITVTGATFTYNNGSAAVGGTDTNVKVASVAFPPSLLYRADTPLKATDSDVSTWNNFATWYDTATGAYKPFNETAYDFVKASTQTVALANPANYGVGCLKLAVKCNCTKKITTTQVDANGLETAKTDEVIAVPTDGFKVTGVLVGDQPATVDWQAIGSGTDKVTIYDNDVPSTMTAKTQTGDNYSDYNYTLVFDNWVTDATQAKPRIAIELQNGTEAFTGVDGTVQPNEKFYLIAELDPATVKDAQGNAATLAWPNAAMRFPKSGTNRTFIQDYTTTVKLTINSLKNAYLTIPDLRSVKLKLGVAVDLTWQSGLTFTQNID